MRKCQVSIICYLVALSTKLKIVEANQDVGIRAGWFGSTNKVQFDFLVLREDNLGAGEPSSKCFHHQD